MTLAFQQASTSKLLDVHLRAAFQLARIHLERGDLADASRVAHQGLQVADKYGLSMAPYGLDLQYTHYLAHYAEGAWDHAQEVADGFTARVTSVAEARLSAMALFIDVARGNPSGRRPGHLDAAVLGRGLVRRVHRAEPARRERALAGRRGSGRGRGRRARSATTPACAEKSPPIIRVAATGLAALADLAARARAAGETEQARGRGGGRRRADRAGPGGRRVPAASRGTSSASTGRGWLARAEAEWRRAQGRNDPDAWCEVIEVFGPGVRVRARPGPAGGWPRRWPRPASGRKRRQSGRLAAGRGATSWAPRRCARALARPGPARPAGAGPVDAAAAADGAGGAGRGPLAGLTGREREVLRLLAAGQQQPGDRRGAVHRAQDRQRARVQHPGASWARPAGPRRRPSRTATGSGCPRGRRARPAQAPGARASRISAARVVAAAGSASGEPICGSQLRS